VNEAAPTIDSRAGFEAAVIWGFETAIAQGARCITAVDTTFAGWPLDGRALLLRLGTWLRQPQRRLVLLAADYAGMPRDHPRFVAWRRDWSHAIQPWQAPAELVPTLPTLLLDDGEVSVHLIDDTHWHGLARLDLRTAQLWRQRVDVILQRSGAAFAVNTLGL
jgi:hypothetical protein